MLHTWSQQLSIDSIFDNQRLQRINSYLNKITENWESLRGYERWISKLEQDQAHSSSYSSLHSVHKILLLPYIWTVLPFSILGWGATMNYSTLVFSSVCMDWQALAPVISWKINANMGQLIKGQLCFPWNLEYPAVHLWVSHGTIWKTLP